MLASQTVEQHRGSAGARADGARGARPLPVAPPTGAHLRSTAGAALARTMQRRAVSRAVAATLERRPARTLSRCAGGCSCGGACGHDEALDEDAEALRRAVVARSALGTTGAARTA